MWEPMGNGIDNGSHTYYVRCLLVYRDKLYVGGKFSFQYAQTMNSLSQVLDCSLVQQHDLTILRTLLSMILTTARGFLSLELALPLFTHP
jgi:hypothetical protein